MRGEEPPLLKKIFLALLVVAFFYWFWFEINKSLEINVFQPTLIDLRLLLFPILPLALALSFYTILGILQDIKPGSKWLVSFLIGLPIFFISNPPNIYAATSALVIFLASAWTFERLKLETEDHLKVRIAHLSQAGGLPFFLTIIFISIALLTVAKVLPNIEKNGLKIPPDLVQQNSIFIRLIPGYQELSLLDQSLNPKNALDNSYLPDQKILQKQTLSQMANQLNVEPEPNDDVYDLIRKNLEQQLNKFFHGSASIILLALAFLIFISLTVFRYPIILLTVLISYLLFQLFLSLKLVEISEQTIPAQLPYLGKKDQEE